MTQCGICYEVINQLELDNHQKKCLEHQMLLIEQYNSSPLTELQNKGLEIGFKKAKIFSKNIHGNLITKFINLGYNEKDLHQVVKYVQNDIDIIIHVNLDKTLKYLCQDIFYRNIFETLKGGGSNCLTSRADWERNLFNGVYENAKPFEKVKYGALNIGNHPNGIKMCYPYGDSFLVLKKDIKKRATFVYGDSSKKDFHLSTFENPLSVLYFMPDQLTVDVIKIANYEGEYCENIGEYIEVQIHGSVKLNRDIECLMVNPKYENDKTTIDLLNQFTKETQVPYIFF
jgi:hypothetical protein